MEKILEKSGKSQGILSVRKSGNPDNANYNTNHNVIYNVIHNSFTMSIAMLFTMLFIMSFTVSLIMVFNYIMSLIILFINTNFVTISEQHIIDTAIHKILN